MREVTYKSDLERVDWHQMKKTLRQDEFDNGRSPSQLEAAFENSYATCIAYSEGRILGTARVLSDGVCNAYLVDVWTYSPFRHQGIGSKMVRMLLRKLQGQHVYLFTDDGIDFYKQLGFVEQPFGLSQVIGKWLIKELS